MTVVFVRIGDQRTFRVNDHISLISLEIFWLLIFSSDEILGILAFIFKFDIAHSDHFDSWKNLLLFPRHRKFNFKLIMINWRLYGIIWIFKRYPFRILCRGEWSTSSIYREFYTSILVDCTVHVDVCSGGDFILCVSFLTIFKTHNIHS